jgi:hypothetical protein
VQLGPGLEGRIKKTTGCYVNEGGPIFPWKLEVENRSLYQSEIGRKAHFQSTILEEDQKPKSDSRIPDNWAEDKLASKPTADK